MAPSLAHCGICTGEAMPTTTLREAIVSLLSGDATLGTTLTGGVYNRRDLSRTATPSAYNTTTGDINPCAVVTMSTPVQEAIKEAAFERDWFQVWLYEAEGNNYANIDIAADRVIALLHRQTVTVSPGGIHEIQYADGLGDSYDDVLRCEMSYLRFWAWRYRG